MDPSKFPFDEAGSPSGKGAEGSEADSATGMFSTPPKGSVAPPSVLDALKVDAFAPSPVSSVPQTRPIADERPFSESPAAIRPNIASSANGEPGEFTRMNQAMPFASAPSTPQTESQKPFSSPGTTPQSSKSPAADVTKIFSQLPTPKSAVPKSPAPPVPAPAMTVPGPAPAAGEFTQMFQNLGSNQAPTTRTTAAAEPVPEMPRTTAAKPPSVETEKEAGSFTQLFQSISSSSPSSPEFSPKEQTAPAGKSESGSFTSMFESIQTQPKPEAPFAPQFPEKPRSAPQANFAAPADSPTSQGGFTQLFETLSEDRSRESQSKDQTFSNPANLSFQPPLRDHPPQSQATPMQTGPGEFTRLLQTLADPSGPQEPSVARAEPAFPAPSPASGPPPQQQGPGEYTRIVSNAAFRDAQNRPGSGGPPLASPPQISIPATPQKPAFPSYPVPVAQPQRPAPPPPPSFQVPPPPAFPAPQPPAPAPQPVGKLQQYLPLLIVVNIFVLLVLVLIVLFVLRRH